MSHTKKILKYTGIGFVCLAIFVLSPALSYRKYLQHKVAQRRAIRFPHGIDSLEPVRIGGIDQLIEVRGQNVDNPILLWIHGGPGIGFIPLAGDFQGHGKTISPSCSGTSGERARRTPRMTKSYSTEP